jgi:hypothetical protein
MDSADHGCVQSNRFLDERTSEEAIARVEEEVNRLTEGLWIEY